ncbi:MAG TPA: hypothetical protein VGJ91_05040 [Polyangiaceae bacterium]
MIDFFSNRVVGHVFGPALGHVGIHERRVHLAEQGVRRDAKPVAKLGIVNGQSRFGPALAPLIRNHPVNPVVEARRLRGCVGRVRGKQFAFVSKGVRGFEASALGRERFFGDRIRAEVPDPAALVEAEL